MSGRYGIECDVDRLDKRRHGSQPVWRRADREAFHGSAARSEYEEPLIRQASCDPPNVIGIRTGSPLCQPQESGLGSVRMPGRSAQFMD